MKHPEFDVAAININIKQKYHLNKAMQNSMDLRCQALRKFHGIKLAPGMRANFKDILLSFARSPQKRISTIAQIKGSVPSKANSIWQNDKEDKKKQKPAKWLMSTMKKYKKVNKIEKLSGMFREPANQTELLDENVGYYLCRDSSLTLLGDLPERAHEVF